RALERDLVDPAPGEEGERRLVLTPLAAERRLPVDVGLDAVAVADMHGGRAADALDRPVKRLDPPRRDVVQVDIERGLVELEDVEPERGELPRLLVDNLRELQRKPAAVAVVLVGKRVHDRHGARQRELELPRRVGAREGDLRRVRPPPAPERPGHGGHLGLVAVRADADRDAAGEVDALDVLEKAVDEVLPALFAVGHDVDARRLLLAERDQHRIATALLERRAREPPRRPQRPRLGEPGRLGKAAGDRRQKHGAVLQKGSRLSTAIDPAWPACYSWSPLSSAFQGDSMLRQLAKKIDALQELIGRGVSWFVLAMVVVVFSDVIFRYLFNRSWVFMQELEWHFFGLVYLLAAGYTMLYDEHVRVDIYYAKLTSRKKAWLDLILLFSFFFPTSLLIIYTTWPFVKNSFAVLEGSPDPGGLPGRWALKSTIIIGYALLILQGISQAIKNLYWAMGWEAREERAHEIHSCSAFTGPVP